MKFKEGHKRIRPSSAVIVESNCPLSECLAKMKAANIGSILVISYALPKDLIGIFTERDLLKWVEQLRNPKAWDTAIGTYMTKKVVTISPAQMDEAAAIMLEKRIRHLPVVTTDEVGAPQVLGVISMRDLFHQMLEEKRLAKAAPKRAASEFRITNFSLNPVEAKLVRSVLKDSGATFRDVTLEELLNEEFFKQEIESGNLLILDIDGITSTQWNLALKRVNQIGKNFHTLVLFNKEKHDEKNIQILRKLSRADNFTVFEKPYSIYELVEDACRVMELDLSS